MPSGSRGPFGYPDYQRVANYDSPTVFTGSYSPGAPAELNSGILNVSRYEYVTLSLTVRGLSASVEVPITFQWSTNFSGSPALLSEVFFIHSLVGELTHGEEVTVTIPCRGPLMKLNLGSVSGHPTGSVSVAMSLTNRFVATPYPLKTPNLIRQTGSAPNLSHTLAFPAWPYAGPVNVAAYCGGLTEKFALQLESLTSAPGGWTLRESLQPNSEVFQRATFFTPLGEWRLNLTNASGAEQPYEIQASPSVTG